MSVRKVRARPPEIIKNRWFFLFRMQTGLFELLLPIVAVLVPNDLQNGTKNGPKSIQKSIQNDIQFSITFLITFWSSRVARGAVFDPKHGFHNLK